MESIVTINVSGQRFEMSRDALSKFPNTTLGRTSFTADNTATFYRLSSIFKCILNYYETGHLHIPNNVCLGSVKDELTFWGFTTDDLDVCCRRRLLKFTREQKYLQKFEESVKAKQEHSCCSSRYSQTCIVKARNQIWLILDKPASSVYAKIYFVISSLIVILSVVVVYIKSIDELNEKMSAENWKQYYGDDYEDHASQVRLLTGYDEDLDTSNSTSKDERLGNFTFPSDVYKDPAYVFPLNLFCTVFFAVELTLKFVCCPSIFQLFKSLLHIVDILAVAVTVAHVVIDALIPAEQYTITYMDAVGALLVLRVLRLFRLAKGVTGASVLSYTLSNSYKEIGFMVLLIAINTIVFGTLAYNLDRTRMKSLPMASWWALITMTTVGYGDIVPSNDMGRLVGVACACMGIGLLALTMPLFVDNFLTLYSYASVLCEEKETANTAIRVNVAPCNELHSDDQVKRKNRNPIR